MEGNKAVYNSIDDYISIFPVEVQEKLSAIRNVIKEAAPEAKETISYQMPTFVLHGNLVHFAAFKNHIGFYPTASGTEAFEQQLSAYKGGKGSIQFPLNQPIPYELIRSIVAFRVAKNTEKALLKSKKKK
ncbi:MAG: DUF1801 domain-containing protein [Candidatus Cohnella colombiensis]|uniref:DUF1801 domain-containing protein n=1 Tax=Candidatus Cohnella colombiensis TaxID=3121368 RepID=A0AA95EU85_9BACL|nr:MAG: DUF1801 domain-containing protein [Cohnella sp.]